MLNKDRSVLIQANVPFQNRCKVMQEAIATTTKLDGLITMSINGKIAARYEHFGLGISKFVKHLQTSGEAGVIKTTNKNTPKI